MASKRPFLTITTVQVNELLAVEKEEIIQLCTAAFEEDFADFFHLFPNTVHILGRVDGVLVSHLAWVTRWLQPAGLAMLKTAYIEAVATVSAHQGNGYASALMRKAATEIQSFDLAALSPSDVGFYERFGWQLWRGPLGVRREDGVEPSPTDEAVMVLPLPNTPPLELNALLTVEWREGDVW